MTSFLGFCRLKLKYVHRLLEKDKELKSLPIPSSDIYKRENSTVLHGQSLECLCPLLENYCS